MTDEQNFQIQNMAFFKSAFLDPEIVFSGPKPSWLESTAILGSIGLIETTLWLRLGMEIGFFDEESVAAYLAPIEDGLGAVWSALVERNALTSGTWCDFMSDGPKPIFMRDKFFRPQEQLLQRLQIPDNPINLEYQRLCFLTSLLATSEVIFEPNTMVILQSIGWDTDEKWENLIHGYSTLSDFRLDDLYVGFANHLQYLEQLPPYLAGYVIDAAEYPLDNAEMFSFYQKVTEIISQRIIINRAHVKKRVFKFASEILAISYRSGPEWQQVRRSIFSQLARITEGDSESSHRPWSDFVNNTEELGRALRERRFESFEGPSFAKE
jgi:hypothetical protein